MTQFTLALFQHECGSDTPSDRLDALDEAMQKAARAGADLLITPELYLSGYNIGDDVVELAESADGPSLIRAGEIAARHGVALLLAYPERVGETLHIAAALIGKNGERAADFRKLHCAGAWERSTFSPGAGIVTGTIDGVTIAPLICYDVEMPEAVRAAARAGADIVAVPTALRHQYVHLTRTMIPTRAFENGLFVAYVNQAGSEGDWTYCGNSTIAGPSGYVRHAGTEPELMFETIDLQDIVRARAELPYLEQAREFL